MIVAYALFIISGLFYGILITNSPVQQPLWSSVFSFARLCGAAGILYYLLQFTGIPPILGVGTFLGGMWMWIFIHIQRS